MEFKCGGNGSGRNGRGVRFSSPYDFDRLVDLECLGNCNATMKTDIGERQPASEGCDRVGMIKE